jgi:hypothetical protein
MGARDRLASALNLSQVQKQHAELLAELQQAHERWQSYAAERRQLSKSVASTGALAGNWRSRSLTVEQASITRDQAQAYLVSLRYSDGYLFIPQRFELKVLQDGDDLMSWTQGSSNQLEMTLVGNYLIRSE